MKKAILLAINLMSISAVAQVTVNSTYIATLGDTVIMGEDTTHAAFLDLGSAVGNQVWDFTNLEEQKPDGIFLEDPSTAPLSSMYPDADFVGNDLEEDSIHLFFKQTSTYLVIAGIVEYDSIGNPVPGELDGKWRFMQFPATMGTTFESDLFTQVQSNYWGVDLDSIGPHPFVDSLRAKISFSFYNEIDAWGEVQLPQGSYNCIRQKTVAKIRSSGDCFFNGEWRPYTPLMLTFLDSVNYDTATDGSYKWWSDNASADLFVAQIDFDSLGNPDSNISYLLAVPTWPVGVNESAANSMEVFPNPTSDYLTVKTTLDGTWDATLYDVNAKTVLQQKEQTTSASIDLSELPAGTYLLQITDANGGIVKLEKVQITH